MDEKFLKKSIIQTLIFYDIFEKPLKLKDLYFQLEKTDGKKPSFFSFCNVLESLVNEGLVKKKDDYYFLKNKEDYLKFQKERNEISKKNWRKLAFISKIINIVPFICMVGVLGSLSIDNCSKKSDIDLIIITKKNRIFLVRFFLTILLDLFFVRRTKTKIARRVCLNNFIAEDNLTFPFPSLYNAHSFSNLIPIIDRDSFYFKFKEKNNWVLNYLYFWKDKTPPFFIKKQSKIALILEEILKGNFGDFLEKKVKNIQIKRKNKNYPFGVKNGRVILNDTLIELHPNSKEKRIEEEYKLRLKNYLRPNQ